MLDRGIESVKTKFRTLLQAGAQSDGLPADMKAAGQYLNNYGFDQRGLFGTAAAIRSISADPLHSSDVVTVESLVRYVASRDNVELSARADAQEVVRSRLAVEKSDVFKTADVVYSLTVCPSAVSGREAILTSLLGRLTSTRRPSGGWAVDLDPAGECDLLATAHVTRALHFAGVQIDSVDLRMLGNHCFDDQATGGQIYVQCFALLVLLQVDARRVRREARRAFRRMLLTLGRALDVQSEANYEYTIGSRQYYVRVPWQLYLIEACARLYPWSRFLSWKWQQRVLRILQQLDSPDGFVYESSGRFESTRTHAILSDTLFGLRNQYSRSQYLSVASSVINVTSRLSTSRPVMVTVGGAAVGLAGYSTYEWLGTNG
ncbi:MAG: hypothetical protein ACREQV_13135, partial [Candidatus Binatia bacterium]